MKINCLSCGHKLELDEEVYADYEGQAKCYVCGRLLEIRMEQGKLKSLHLYQRLEAPPADKGTSDQP
jgi:transcription elongation factor Elf1